jgi:phosphatidylserine/phosphatidylglycerophosphate/cardiolipin synthase-like enzyme
MSDLRAVVDAFIALAQTPSEVDTLRASVELLTTHPDRKLTAHKLQQLYDDSLTRSSYTEFLYRLEEAEIWDGHEMDRESFTAAVGGAKTLVAGSPPAENDVVVNVPEGDDEHLGRSLGSLVVRLTELIHDTDDELVILNPFFSEQAFRNIVTPVVSALERGVSVILITRYLTYGTDDDSREFVRRLRSAAPQGDLTCYEYIDPEEGANATLHAKMIVSDRSGVYMGTANLTHRGLRDNLEVGVIFRDETAEQFVRFTDDLLESKYLHTVDLNEDGFTRQ